MVLKDFEAICLHEMSFFLDNARFCSLLFCLLVSLMMYLTVGCLI